MIRRIRRIAVQRNVGELRIRHNEVLGKSTVPHQAAGDVGNCRGVIEGLRELSDASVRKKCLECRIGAQSGRTGHSVRSHRRLTAIHHEALQHLVEQWRIPAITRGVERIENTVLKDVGNVDGNAADQLRPLAADYRASTVKLLATWCCNSRFQF